MASHCSSETESGDIEGPGLRDAPIARMSSGPRFGSLTALLNPAADFPAGFSFCQAAGAAASASARSIAASGSGSKIETPSASIF